MKTKQAKNSKIFTYFFVKGSVFRRAKSIAFTHKILKEEREKKKKELYRYLYEKQHYFKKYLDAWNEHPEFRKILYPQGDDILKAFLQELQEGHTDPEIITRYEERLRAQERLFYAIERNNAKAFLQALKNGADFKTVIALHDAVAIGSDFAYYTTVGNIVTLICNVPFYDEKGRETLMNRFKEFSALAEQQTL